MGSQSRYSDTLVIGGRDEPDHYRVYSLPSALVKLGGIDVIGDSATERHVWTLTDRLDKLAERYYGDGEYWWVIAVANGITYPLGIELGTELLIPTELNVVMRNLNLV